MSRRFLSFVAVVAAMMLCALVSFVEFTVAHQAALSASGAVSQDAASDSDSAQSAGVIQNAPAPSVQQSYLGTNQCFQCHRQQANAWSETGHAQAFTDLPERYRNDASCLQCHVTGYGQAQGYAAGTEKDLLMVGCESCHGPGAQHVDAAQRFVMAIENEAAIEKEMRESIVKTPKDTVCAGCHTTVAHGIHPPYEDALPPPATTAVGHQVTALRAHSAINSRPTRYTPGYSIKTCGSCHYDQYKQWGAERHANLAARLPAKYASDQECRKCHASADASAESVTLAGAPHHNQVGAACETCHGPALDHVRFNVRYIHAPPLGPQLEQAARLSIRNGKPAATCIQCHIHETHQEHPQFDNQ